MFKSIVNFVKLTDTAQTPTHGSEQAAGWDLYADLGTRVLLIPPHETVMIPTGIASALRACAQGGPVCACVRARVCVCVWCVE